MANRIVVDPITRIEGHLRIEAEIKDGKIADAFSSSTMVRGIENIVKGSILLFIHYSDLYIHRIQTFFSEVYQRHLGSK